MMDIWRRAAESGENFEEAALELFAFQAERCAPYRRYLELIGCDIAAVKSIAQIPFLPIELFKGHEVYSAPIPPEVVFTSSSTTGSVPSRHAMASLHHYESVAVAAFEREFGALSGVSIYALLPGYLEREGSSLIYMVDQFIKRAKGGGFFLREHDKLIEELRGNSEPKILLGVSYALLDLIEGGDLNLENIVVMETGGMKGKRAEMPKEELHQKLCNAFGVNSIASEYGMAELTSQAYSHGEGLFTTPPWMRVIIRDINNPFRELSRGERGGINILDLASWHSCAFIETQDIGRIQSGGFTLEGRIDRSETRGCNLLVD